MVSEKAKQDISGSNNQQIIIKGNYVVHSALTTSELESILDRKLRTEGVFLSHDSREEITKAMESAFLSLQYKLDNCNKEIDWGRELKKPSKQIMLNHLINIVLKMDLDVDQCDGEINPTVETAISMIAKYILSKSGTFDQAVLEESTSIVPKMSKEMLFVLQLLYFITKRSCYVGNSRTIFLRYISNSMRYIRQYDYVRQLSYLKYLKCVDDGSLVYDKSVALYDYLDLKRKPEIVEYLSNEITNKETPHLASWSEGGVFRYEKECAQLVDILYPLISEYGHEFVRYVDNEDIRNVTEENNFSSWVIAKVVEGLFSRRLLRNKLGYQKYIDLCSIIKEHNLVLSQIGEKISENLPDIVGNWNQKYF